MNRPASAGNEPEKSATIFNRNFNVVALINLFTMTAYYLLFVSTPYATRFFHTSPGVAGLVAEIMVIGCLAGRFITGNLICILGSERVLLAGILLSIASITMYFIAHTLAALIAVRFVSGIGIGTAPETIVAYVVPRHQQGPGISYFSRSTALALALGHFWASHLCGSWNTSGCFCCVSALAQAIYLFFGDYPCRIEGGPPARRRCCSCWTITSIAGSPPSSLSCWWPASAGATCGLLSPSTPGNAAWSA